MIPITYLRSSMYSTHEMCPMQYFAEYVLGWTGKSGQKADMGTIVHKFMEVLAVWKKTHQDGKKTFKDEVLGTCTINKQLNYFTVKKKQITITKLRDLVYEYYTSRLPHHVWQPAHFRDISLWCKTALEFGKGRFHPLKQNIVMPEQHFDIEVKEPWAVYDYPEYGLKGCLHIKGTMDLVASDDIYTNEVVDYKTGQCKNWATGQRYTWASLHHNFQLRLYHYVASVLYPDKDIQITIYYIRDGGPFTIPLGKDDIPETLRMIRNKFEMIRDTEVPQMKKSWMCKKLCHQGKSTFEDTNVYPLIQQRQTSQCFASCGDTMLKCDQLAYALQNRPIDVVIKNMTKDGHDFSYYKPPGEIE